MKHKYRVGRKITVVSSTHSGLHLGDEGVIESLMQGGYAVKFHKTWQNTFVNEKPPTETRTVFMTEDQILPKK